MLGLRIEHYRKKAGLSRAELGRRLGLTPCAVASYEQGRRTPDAQTMDALSRILGVSADYLITGNTLNRPSSGPGEFLVRAGDGRIINLLDAGNALSGNELAVLFSALLAEK